MSGLAGLVFLDERTMDESALERMSSAGLYRARDGVQLWHSAKIGLIRFKQATTPEAVRERQPFEDVAAGAVICFDGRIDNRQELCRALSGSVVLEEDVPDCVVVLALFQRYGPECVQHLVGDYALAIWETKSRRLFCARSPLGFRPFHWYCDGKTFAFASDAKIIIDGLQIKPQVNEAAIGEFLAMHFTNPRESLWRDIERLEPGSAIIVEDGRTRSWHWHQGPFPDLSDVSENDLIDRFKSLFDQAIASCMRSITPVAAHLSGGLDSSSIVCRAVQLYRAGALDALIRPISVRFPGEDHDEGVWIQAVEEQLSLKSMVVTSNRYDWDRARNWCAETYHLPLRPNVLGTVVGTCYRLQREGIGVLLTGEGGDDWLNGSCAHWADLLGQFRIRELFRQGLNRGCLRKFLGSLYRIALFSAGPWCSRRQRRQLLQPNYDCSYVVPEWIDPRWARKIGMEERWRADEPVMQLKSFALQQRYARYGFARPYVNVENVQAFIESQGIEVRHPLHDLRLTRFFMGVPGNMLLRNGQRKYLLREAMRDTLPEKVRTRQTKANLSSPIVDAAAEFLADCNVSQLLCVQQGWVKGESLQHIFAAHRAWSMSPGDHAMPRASLGAVWSALSIELWLRHAAGL